MDKRILRIFTTLVLSILWLSAGDSYAQILEENDNDWMNWTEQVDTLPNGDTLFWTDEMMVADSIARADSIALADSLRKIRERGFDATRYSMQKRHRPANESFINKKFINNTFVTIGAGFTSLFPLADNPIGMGPGGMIAFGKMIDPYHNIRIGIAGNMFQRNSDNTTCINGELMISHMFNMMSYVNGYKHTRFFELSTIEGISLDYTNIGGLSGFAGGIHLGFNLKFRLSKHLDFFAEPLATIYTDNIDRSGTNNWHRYDIGYRGNFGLNIKITPKEQLAAVTEFPGSNMFVFYAGGIQLQNSAYVLNEIGPMEALGVHASLGYGNWFNRVLALRGSLFYSEDYWRQYNDKSKSKTHYAGARLEFMFDPTGFGKNWEKRVVCVPLMVGPEIGYMSKIDKAGENINRYYVGLTAAMQLKFKIKNILGLYFEPRFSLIPYSVNHSDIPDVWYRINYYDGIVNLSFGLEHYF